MDNDLLPNMQAVLDQFAENHGEENPNLIIKIQDAEGQITEISEKELISQLIYNDDEDLVERIEYKDFELIVRGRKCDSINGKVISHFNGYIMHVSEELRDRVNIIFNNPEVEEIVHGGWTGSFEDAIGFDCAHYNDITIHESLKSIMGMFDQNVDVVKRFTSRGYLHNPEATFKNKEYILEILRKVANKTLELMEN